MQFLQGHQLLIPCHRRAPLSNLYSLEEIVASEAITPLERAIGQKLQLIVNNWVLGLVMPTGCARQATTLSTEGNHTQGNKAAGRQSHCQQLLV